MPGQPSLIEDAITQALAELDSECERFGIRLLLIGGFAVRAYGSRKRETTDVDFVTSRTNRNTLAELFQRLGYEFIPQTRFGMKAIRFVGERKLQVDIVIEEIHDLSAGSVYRFPPESFAKAKRYTVESISGDFRAEAYVIPLADLLISKLMTARPQDASDVINLMLDDDPPSESLRTEIVRKARQANLVQRLNSRIAQLVTMSDAEIQALMAKYTGGRLTRQEIIRLKTSLRSLRI